MHGTVQCGITKKGEFSGDLMEENITLSEKEISVINQLMGRRSEIILEPRKDGYLIYESKKKLILRPEKQLKINTEHQ